MPDRLRLPFLRRTAWVLGALLAAVLIAALARAALLPSRQHRVPPVPPLALDVHAAAQRLAAGLRLATVSYDDRPDASADAFQQLHRLLERSYPQAHRAMRRETVNTHTLLYTWPGRDPAAPPIVLLAHQDVVPVAEDTLARWTHPPFAGVVADGHVWGRGAWDNKGNLFAMMEAVERLATDGFQPPQTVYFVFGHDEEMGNRAGQRGAQPAARLLRERGVHAAFVLDEGLVVTQGVMPGLDKPVALIGLAEKGFLTMTLSARATPGHSSTPPARTAIGALANALQALEAQPMPAALEGIPRETLDILAPEFGGLQRVALANLWLTAPLVQRQLQATPGGNAMMRTTVAPTLLRAGDKVQVLPGEAMAALNVRLKPGDTADAVLAHARHALQGHDVQLRLQDGAWPASPVSSTAGAGYRRIEAAVREVFPGTLVAPGLMVGATDARHFTDLADDIYRFSPVRAGPADLPRFHGIDERLSLQNLGEMIRFYHRLLTSSGSTAVASISTLARSSISAVTSTAVIAMP